MRAWRLGCVAGAGAALLFGCAGRSATASGHGGASSGGTANGAAGAAGAAVGGGGSHAAGAGGTGASAGRNGGAAAGGAEAAGRAGQGGGRAGAGAGGERAGAGRGQGGRPGSGAGGSAGAAGSAAPCTNDGDCPGGACFAGLDGSRTCVTPISDPTHSEDPSCTGANCCLSDDECTAADGGRCISVIASELTCGGAAPSGNTCLYAACQSDDACVSLPAGATHAVCLPSGAFGVFTSTCVYGGCRTDADCTQGPGGECLYGLAATKNGCDLHYVLYCGYSSDPCTDRGSCGSPTQVCAPEDDFQGRHCVQGPPMYP